MKRLLLLLVILISASMSAQIKVKINGKLITEQTITKAQDIKKLEIAFDKYRKLDYYGLGRLFLWVEILDEKGNVKEEYGIRKDGTNAIKIFLEDVNVFYAMASDSDPKSDLTAFRTYSDKNITAKLKYFGKNFDSKTVKLRISLCFQDSIGYEKYGDCVDLIKAQTFTIDNTLYFTEGQKEKEQDKIVADAKKAEDAQKAEEAKKEAEKQQKAEKKKGLLKGILNRI